MSPDSHGIGRAEQGHFAYAVHTAQGVKDGGAHKIAQVRRAHGIVGRHERVHLKEAVRHLGYGDALPRHFFRQGRSGELELVLHLHLRHVGIGIGIEGEPDGNLPGGVAGGVDIQQAVDAVQFLFDDLRDRVLKRLSRGPGIFSRDGDHRRRDARILLHGQAEYRNPPSHHDQDGDNPREHRAVYKKTCHKFSMKLYGCIRDFFKKEDRRSQKPSGGLLFSSREAFILCWPKKGR